MCINLKMYVEFYKCNYQLSNFISVIINYQLDANNAVQIFGG